MRAITASGMVPSTIVGRIEVRRRAERKAPFWPDSSAVDQHEAGHRLEEVVRASMRPETGVQPSMPEKNRMSSRPHQKIGIE